jgi:membrane protein implicated in regulation of membrane protease activity
MPSSHDPQQLPRPLTSPFWLLVAVSMPPAAAFGVGLLFAGTATFNVPLAGAAAVLCVVAIGLPVLIRRPVGGKSEGDFIFDGALPAVGGRVRVRTHFTEVGGYVEHGGCVFWAGATDALVVDMTPGTECAVIQVDGSGLVVRPLVSGLSMDGALS